MVLGFGFVYVFSFQTLIKDKYLSILQFVNRYCLKMAFKTHNTNSKFNKKLDIFANLTVDGAQNAFYEN